MGTFFLLLVLYIVGSVLTSAAASFILTSHDPIYNRDDEVIILSIFWPVALILGVCLLLPAAGCIFLIGMAGEVGQNLAWKVRQFAKRKKK